MIQVKGLTKYYSGHRAIEDISFYIREGEIIGLLGLNGAGKSTILKILGCFLLPSAGSAYIEGHSVEDHPEKIRSLIGVLPDTPPLYNEMTVHAYLSYVARLKGVPSKSVDEMVRDAMKRASLVSVADQVIAGLSHGYRQRVGIAQAIVHKPKVLILDEPINGLDPIQIVEMRDLIVSLKSEHTVILSSHILSEITKTCDRIFIVDQGRLVAEGREQDLLSSSNQSMRLDCEARNVSDATLSSIKAIEGVHSVVTKNEPNAVSRLTIDLHSDQRAQIARAVVQSGAELLELSRQGAGLENLFMQFVRK